MRKWLTVLATVMAPATMAAAPARTPALPIDTERAAAVHYGNDAPWYLGNIPFFASSDPKLDAVYYYRWKVLRAHQRDLGAKGYITTEFLDDVGWQREPYASLNDASGFHLYEARWLHDRRYADDYLDYLYLDGGNDRHFSEAIADAVWARYLVDGDRDAAVRLLPAMRHVYGLWDDHLDRAKGLYWIEPLLDATEYTIASIDASGGRDGFTGGQAFRPSINSYMAANARAIGRIAALAGQPDVSADYLARGDAVRTRILADLWSPSLGHFIDRHRTNNEYVRYWQPIRGRELVGYLPWTYGLIDDADRAEAWLHVLDPAKLAGTAALRTVEPSYQYYMRQYRYDKDTGRRECQWNGPSWPFQTTQVLLGLANLLHGGAYNRIGRADYLRLLRQYAVQHYQAGRLDLEEDYDPDTGRPIVGLARSHHYFHSGFDDLIITGLVGLVPQPDDRLTVDPLLPTDRSAPDRLRWFALQDVLYKGHSVSIIYDEIDHYHHGVGLRVYVDGHRVAARADLGRLDVRIAARPNAPVIRELDLAAQLERSGFPRLAASSNPDARALHQAVDGRVWFFPEPVNGWTSGSGRSTEWFSVDLGRVAKVARAELSFFADDTITPPTSVDVQAWADSQWHTIKDAIADVPVANGVTKVRFHPISTTRIRLLLHKCATCRFRLIEAKVFG